VGRTQGRHGGSRRGAKPRPTFRPSLLLLAIGVTLAVVAWGYLVYAAVDFGSEARAGQDEAWWFLALAGVGAAACLFVGLMLIVRLLRALGLTSPPPPKEPPAAAVVSPAADPAPPRAPGGKRAAR
jgi:hypothetical protein